MSWVVNDPEGRESMIRSSRIVLAAAAALLLGGAVGAADFTYGFRFPGEGDAGCPPYGTEGTALQVAAGTTELDMEVFLTLTTANNTEIEGPQGWSFGLQVTNATIDKVSTFDPITPESDPADIAGLNLQVSTLYDADQNPDTPLKDPHMLWLYKAGFAVFENAYVTQKPSRPTEEKPVGAVCAIVLHQTKKMVLQPLGTQDIAKLKVKVPVPASGASKVTFQYKEGLFGAGEAVGNVVTFKSTSNTPVLGECSFYVKQVSGPEKTFQLSILPADEPATTVATQDGQNNILARDVSIPSGSTSVDFQIPVVVKLTTANLLLLEGDVEPADGPQGWSLGFRHDPSLSLATKEYVDIEGSTVTGPEIYPPIPATTRVSVLYDNDGDGGPNATPPGTPDIERQQDLALAGFVVSEKAYVTAKATRPVGELPVGIVSAIVLHQTKKMVLHANTTDIVIRAVFVMKVNEGQNADATLTVVNGLFGSGEAVDNIITYKSTSNNPTIKNGLVLRLKGVTSGVVKKDGFIRGDANNDGRVNIADVIWIVYHVVPGLGAGGAYELPCQDAGDVNDDESVNLADALSLINYQFKGQAAPATPFPGCGTDTDSTEVSCPDASTNCPSQ
jgi:hypothetical protein